MDTRDGPTDSPALLCWYRTADMLVHEVLSRKLRDRRAVARYAGLTGAPTRAAANGGERARQGGQRTSTRRNDSVGWRFLLFQKDSALAQLVSDSN